MLEVRLLGQFEVRSDGAPVAIPSRAAQSLFAFLLLTAGTMHRREKLAGQLWPDTTEENARKNLRHELWRLRKAIETKTPRKGVVSFLFVDDISIGFDAESNYWLDVALVRQKLGKEPSADDLIQTLSLYRGELLPGWYDEWVVLERGRVHAVFEQKMARLLQLLIEDGRWDETLEWAERWIALGQTPEPAFRALMVAHGALGSVSQVASVYERCRRAMHDDLGVEPSEQTRALFERLSKRGEPAHAVPSRGDHVADQFKIVPPSLQSKSVPQPSRIEPVSGPSSEPVHRTGHLPVPLTSFIGREHEIEQVKHSLSTTRLLSLIGSGGVGKTRLAIQLASDLSSEYKDGAWWADLVPLSDPALVPQAVAKALGVREVPNVPLMETLADTLCSKQILLVLDNCEHLIGASAQLADSLLGSCVSLKILTTSREALGVSGELVWRVPSLSLPKSQPSRIEELDRFESARLFIERARSANPDFTPTQQNALAIAQICQRLDGIPLAIELAAARVKTLSLDQIAVRLDDRFNLLSQGSRTALPRHQTLCATIDWSYDLLAEPEKLLFRRLAVFAGGWSLEAAEAVCAGEGLEPGQVLEVLSRLVDKSLVTAEVQEGPARYHMLETIRQYSSEKLADIGQAHAVDSRHLSFFANLAEDSEARLFRATQSSVLDRLELEIDNLRAAVDWALENGQVITALRLVSAIPRFWFIRAHHNEGLERLRAILSLPEAMQPSPARLKALNAYLFMLWPSGQLTEFEPLIEEAVKLGSAFGDRWNTAFALLWQGVSSTLQGEYLLARSHLEQSLEMYERLGDATYSAWALVFLGEVELLQGNIVRAQGLYEQAIPRLEESKDYPFLAIPQRRLGQLAMLQDDPIKASTLIKASLTSNWSVRDYRGVAACLAALGAKSMMQEHMERATKLLGVVDAILEFIRTPMLPFDRQHYERNVAALRAQRDDTAFAAAWADGHTMSLEQAIAFAMEEKTTTQPSEF